MRLIRTLRHQYKGLRVFAHCSPLSLLVNQYARHIKYYHYENAILDTDNINISKRL